MRAGCRVDEDGPLDDPSRFEEVLELPGGMSRTAGVLRPTHESADWGAIARSEDVKYMLMMHAPRAGWEKAGIGTWPPEDIKAHIGFMKGLNTELREAGELVGAEGLAGPGQDRGGGAPQNATPQLTAAPVAEPTATHPCT